MKRGRLRDAQIIVIPKAHEGDVTVSDLCGKHGTGHASVF